METEKEKSEFCGGYVPKELKKELEIYLIKKGQSIKDWLIEKIKKDLEVV